jgi:hypothetical protein
MMTTYRRSDVEGLVLEEDGDLVVAHWPGGRDSGGMQLAVSCEHALSVFGVRVCGRWTVKPAHQSFPRAFPKVPFLERKKRNRARNGRCLTSNPLTNGAGGAAGVLPSRWPSLVLVASKEHHDDRSSVSFWPAWISYSSQDTGSPPFFKHAPAHSEQKDWAKRRQVSVGGAGRRLGGQGRCRPQCAEREIILAKRRSSAGELRTS